MSDETTGRESLSSSRALVPLNEWTALVTAARDSEDDRVKQAVEQAVAACHIADLREEGAA